MGAGAEGTMLCRDGCLRGSEDSASVPAVRLLMADVGFIAAHKEALKHQRTSVVFDVQEKCLRCKEWVTFSLDRSGKTGQLCFEVVIVVKTHPCNSDTKVPILAVQTYRNLHCQD